MATTGPLRLAAFEHQSDTFTNSPIPARIDVVAQYLQAMGDEEGLQRQAPPQYSADGRWYWTGSQWVPSASLQPKTGGFRRLVARGAVLGVVVLLGFAWAHSTGQEESENAPTVGECARSADDDEIQTVDCTDPAAEYRVTRRADGTTDGDTACATDPEATSYYAFETSSQNLTVTSFVLCLADN